MLALAALAVKVPFLFGRTISKAALGTILSDLTAPLNARRVSQQ